MNDIPKSHWVPFCTRNLMLTTNKWISHTIHVQRTSSISHHTHTVHAIDGHEQIVSFFLLGHLMTITVLLFGCCLLALMKPFDIVNCEHHQTVCTHANNNDTILKLNFEKWWKKIYFSYRHCSLSQHQKQQFLLVFLVLVTHVTLAHSFDGIFSRRLYSKSDTEITLVNWTWQWTVNRTVVRTKKKSCSRQCV